MFIGLSFLRAMRGFIGLFAVNFKISWDKSRCAQVGLNTQVIKGKKKKKPLSMFGY